MKEILVCSFNELFLGIISFDDLAIRDIPLEMGWLSGLYFSALFKRRGSARKLPGEVTG